MSAYATNLLSGDFAPLTWNREQCPNGLLPEIKDGVLRLGVQTGAYAASSGEGDVRDRCELRDPDRLPTGTPVVYDFHMRVPSDLPKVDARFVCMQIKASFDDDTGGSPLVALRYDCGRMLITAEGQFGPDDELTLEPFDPDRPSPYGLVLDHSAFLNTSDHQVRIALATDRFGLPGQLAPHYSKRSHRFVILRSGYLPEPDGEFHRWTFQLRASRLQGEHGMLQVWCDGRPVASIMGQLGSGQQKQWFKIGPYRDKSPLWGDAPAVLEFKDVRRAASLLELS